MKRFYTFNEAMPHSFTQAEICNMSTEELADAIRTSESWDADLLADLIWRAFPDFEEPWEVGGPICFDAAEELGVDILASDDPEPRKFYAVQHGDDYAQDWGSESYSEAVKMAEGACEDYPGEEIRIVTCTPDDCGDWTVDAEEIIREGSR